MVKKARTERDEEIRRQKERVRIVRQRYARALLAGKSPAEAAQIANSEQSSGVEEPEPKPAAPDDRSKWGFGGGGEARTIAEPLSVSTERTPLARTSRTTIAGSGAENPDNPVADNIPPNWKDLPWPQLRTLAERLTDEVPRSRVQAEAMIEKALGGRK